MATITGSVSILGPIQADGRRYCTESHTDSTGGVRVIEYLASIGTDYAAVMTARVPGISAQLDEGEAVKNIASNAAPTYAHITAGAFIVWLRLRYRDATRDQLCDLSGWILKRIADGHVTDATLRTAFGLTNAQWTALKTKMTGFRDSWTATQSAMGE